MKPHSLEGRIALDSLANYAFTRPSRTGLSTYATCQRAWAYALAETERSGFPRDSRGDSNPSHR